jgi:hypothetical protein
MASFDFVLLFLFLYNTFVKSTFEVKNLAKYIVESFVSLKINVS